MDDEGRPITEKKKKARRIFNDAHLQEGQDIFGVDFDYDEFDKYDEQDYEDESEAEDEYEEDGADGVEREKRPKKAVKKKTARKSIFEIYEPSELKRGHFTDLDNEVSKLEHFFFQVIFLRLPIQIRNLNVRRYEIRKPSNLNLQHFEPSGFRCSEIFRISMCSHFYDFYHLSDSENGHSRTHATP